MAFTIHKELKLLNKLLKEDHIPNSAQDGIPTTSRSILNGGILEYITKNIFLNNVGTKKTYVVAVSMIN